MMVKLSIVFGVIAVLCILIFGFVFFEPFLTEKEEEIIDSDQHNYEGVSTISMAVLFSVLAVLYIGFCAYYRKNQRSGSDPEEEWRQQRRRENQVSIREYG